jgi:polyisoprenoid-binding protein YceI
LVAAAVAVVVIVVGGYIAIRAVEGGSKAVLTLPTVTTTTAAATGSGNGTGTTVASGPVDVSGTWKVVDDSTTSAGYRVQETLFGVSNTAVGRTNAVTGTFSISGTTVTSGSFSVDLTKVTSDRSERDQQFQGRIMETSQFPTATFKLTQPIALSTLPSNGVKVTASATGDLMLHGVTKSVTFQVSAQRNGSEIQVQGSIPITFSDWNISNPSGGPATTGNTGTLEFLLDFAHS